MFRSFDESDVFAPGIDQPIVQYDGGGTSTRKFLSSDERGSIISLTDSSGTLIGINSYDEYGRPGSANIGRFQYTGQMWIAEAGLYDYKARTYLPHLGIFAQTDPAGYDAGANLYAYVLNDPVNLVDPFGMQQCDPAQNVGGCGPIIIPAPNRRPSPVVILDNPQPIMPGVTSIGSVNGSTVQKVIVDQSCSGVGAAHDPAVQAKALETLQLGQTAQQRDPDGPPFRE